MLILVAGLADPARRREAARSLAVYLGAEDLIVFSPDFELGVLLPAPGFSQTLPEGRAWKAFLSDCVDSGQAGARLPWPRGAQAQPVLGVAGKDGTVLVLVGGTPHPEEVAEVCLLLPLLAAALQGERIALTSEGQTSVARETAAQASALAESLDRARRDLGEAGRHKDEFLATLAHELRNPLAAILNGLQILQMTADPQRAGRVQEMIGRQTQHLVRLVDDLLNVSRISRGQIELRKERVQLATIVQSAVETSSPAIEASGHQLVVTLPPEPLALHADPARLTQILANLLNNSAKYTERGGRLWLTAERDGGDVVLRVRDNGLGIQAEMLPRIFDLFVQVDDSVERRQSGLGIGLTLVKRLVEMHGGSVEAYSPGLRQGSEVVVRLPLAAGEP